MDFAKLEMREAFIQQLYVAAKADPQIVFVSLDYGAMSLDKYRQDLPQQFVNAAISEQNAIGLAAGLSLKGKKVYVYSIASFITLRCLEQIKLDICSMHNAVTILGVGPCYAYNADGPTHNATEDIALMRSLAGMQVMSPSDSAMAAALVDVSVKSASPMYIRLDKGKYPLRHGMTPDLTDGLKVHREGHDVSLVSTGIMIHTAFEAADELAKMGISAQVVEVYRLKPLNKSLLVESLAKTKSVISIEEHTINGGLGSIVAETLADEGLLIPLKRLGVADELLYTKGMRPTLHAERGIDKAGIVKACLASRVGRDLAGAHGLTKTRANLVELG